MSLYTDYSYYHLPIGPDGTPFEAIEALRDEAVETEKWVGWSTAHKGYWGDGYWVVTGHEEMRKIFHDVENFSSELVNFPPYEVPGPRNEPGARNFIMSGEDDPDHQKVRQIVQPSFSPGKAKQLQEYFKADANLLIDRFIDRGSADVAEELAQQVPGRMTAMLLGSPAEEGDRYRHWVYAMTKSGRFVDPEGTKQKVQELQDYFFDLLRTRRKQEAGGDILSTLLAAEMDGKPLADDQLLDYFVLFMTAGIENTAHLLGTIFWRLSWDRELRRRLIKNPALIPAAIDEFLRIYPAGSGVGRRATTDQVVSGVEIKAGDAVLLSIQTANRDPRAFENPDTFIMNRKDNLHFSLGLGIHRCLGAHLVRVEATVVLTEFLRRIHDFELDPAGSPRWVCGQVEGFDEVPIIFKPVA